jgi:hypothetical protein
MKTILRTFVLAPAVLAAAALTATSAMAASTIKVPFSFTVNGQDCPAGYYTLDRDSNGHIVTLRSNKTAQTFSWVLGPGDPAPTDTKISLEFDQAGSAHALKAVQFGPEVTSNLDKPAKHADHTQQGQ